MKTERCLSFFGYLANESENLRLPVVQASSGVNVNWGSIIMAVFFGTFRFPFPLTLMRGLNLPANTKDTWQVIVEAVT